MTIFNSAKTMAGVIGAALVAASCVAVVPAPPPPPPPPPTPTSASCAAVQANSGTYTVTLSSGSNSAHATINFNGVLTGGFHHNIVSLTVNGASFPDMDLVADQCTNNPGGNAVFNLHPALSTNPGSPNLSAGDKWTFSLPAPSGAYAVTDTTGNAFSNPVTPGFTGYASVP